MSKKNNKKTAKGKIIATNIAAAKGEPKKPRKEIVIDERGVVGDAHAGLWHRQVSLLAQEGINAFNKKTSKAIHHGDFGENITLSGIDLSMVRLLDKFCCGDVILEVTQIGKQCHGKGCSIYREVGKCIMPQRGIFCRVLRGGRIKAGDAIEHLPRFLWVVIITLSDRAYAGEYRDLSGACAKEKIKQFFVQTNWRVKIENKILPDDAANLKKEIGYGITHGVDIIFTLGSTGIGPRDIAPEVIMPLCDKIVDGVMDNIRAQFGKSNPMVWLSRSLFGIAKNTQIFALPGSVRAVDEYLQEIFKVLEHAIFMLHGIDVH